MKRYFFLLIMGLFFLLGQNGSIYSKSKDGKQIKQKVESLLSQMTIDEKIGQMVQADYGAVKNNEDDVKKYFISSILCGGSTDPKDNNPKSWKELYEKFQNIALNTRLKIPIIFGIDAVHGHNNVNGATIFPHNIGLGATRNAKLVEKIGAVTAAEMKGTGIQWDFSPCIAVARNVRWGRTYESFSEDPGLVKELGAAYIKGMQGKNLSDKLSVVACAKHFLGDGGTTNGKDQGNTECSEEEFRKIHLQGYIEAVKTGVKSIMISYSSWNGQKMHGNKYFLTDVLKNELGFKGFVVSDWAGIDQLPGDYKKQIEQSVNAGLDMAMIPNGPGRKNNYQDFIKCLKELVNENAVSMSRIDDAVKRILTVKFELNLFEQPFADDSLISGIGSKKHREIAREAVRQSLVLLKNENNTLPLSKKLKNICVAGKSADDIGNQCGGWTISWQGESGKTLDGGTTILQAIKNTVSSKTQVTFSKDGSGVSGADVCIVVVGETPYAEGRGDREDLSLSAEDQEIIEKAKTANVPVVVVLISGRPLLIDKALKNSNAFIAAWLPGTEGQGVADVLFGDYKPTGKLPHSWPRNMQQIPINVGDKNYDPLFPYGFGLTYK
jgi:beta-glucosidase